MSPDGKFEFEAEMGSATSAVKLSRNMEANKVVVPLMLALLLSAILARWITMRRALGAHRARRAGARKRVHQEQVVEVEQVVDQFMTDEKGNVIGVEETVSVEKRVMPIVTIDSPTQGRRDIREHLERKQRDWKFEAVRIPFWYTLSTLATLVVCVVLDFLVLPAAVNHPLVDFGLAVLHMGVVAATMASLARTIGFVRREWEQYQRGE
ncbi:hypothetical protein BCR44DRAFT_1487421 [Catenaria anguillulae PL171]|uniref:Uncharacterized protein n=1 Tax=Catenaria anguillulae PL171 TaxID=765915 RepID=A0A1Y2HC86_9FUNG|nr:hypothetical protein BCR44DRAFT_1487421 [Catenaria anguillulae PL171]